MARLKRGGAARRKRSERERDLKQIAHLHLQRKTISEIAVELNLSRDTVWKDLRGLEEQWRKDGMLDMHRAKLRQLRELRQIRSEAMEAWEKSKEKEEETTQNIPAEMDEKGNIRNVKGAGKRIRVTVKRKSRVGDARFLELITRTLEQEADLVGTKVRRIEVGAKKGEEAAVIPVGVIALPAFGKQEPPPEDS